MSRASNTSSVGGCNLGGTEKKLKRQQCGFFRYALEPCQNGVQPHHSNTSLSAIVVDAWWRVAADQSGQRCVASDARRSGATNQKLMLLGNGVKRRAPQGALTNVVGVQRLATSQRSAPASAADVACGCVGAACSNAPTNLSATFCRLAQSKPAMQGVPGSDKEMVKRGSATNSHRYRTPPLCQTTKQKKKKKSMAHHKEWFGYMETKRTAKDSSKRIKRCTDNVSLAPRTDGATTAGSKPDDWVSEMKNNS